MSFEERLGSGEFLIPKCSQCERIVWPPSEYCSSCFGKVGLERLDFEARIVEFSRENDKYFCIVEIERSFKIIAKADRILLAGEIVSISKCGVRNGNYFFEIN